MGDLVYLVECKIFDRKLADRPKPRKARKRTAGRKAEQGVDLEARASEPAQASPQPRQRVAVPDRKLAEVIPPHEDISYKTVDPDKERDHATFHTADGKPLIALLIGKEPDERLIKRYAPVACTSIVGYALISIRHYKSNYLLQTSFKLTKKGYGSFEQALRAEFYRRRCCMPKPKPNGDLSVRFEGYSFLLKPKGQEGEPVLVTQTNPRVFSFSESELRWQKTEVGGKVKMVLKPKDASKQPQIYDALLQTYGLKYLEPSLMGRT